MRIVLYLYILLIACPLRYWPVETSVDETWRFALNYAPAQGLLAQPDIVFTSGPLGYLVFPQNIGNNLVRGLTFQSALWLALALIFADIFFRAGFPLRNLALFAFYFCLVAPLYWFDFVGPEMLILTAALMLLLMFHLRGSWARYIVALFLLGLLPLFKLTAAMIGFAAVAGF